MFKNFFARCPNLPLKVETATGRGRYQVVLGVEESVGDLQFGEVWVFTYKGSHAHPLTPRRQQAELLPMFEGITYEDLDAGRYPSGVWAPREIRRLWAVEGRLDRFELRAGSGYETNHQAPLPRPTEGTLDLTYRRGVRLNYAEARVRFRNMEELENALENAERQMVNKLYHEARAEIDRVITPEMRVRLVL